MTARASTLEHVCSSCKSLVLRGEATDAPSCSSCARVICGACELGGLCVSCAAAAWTQPLELEDERVLVVVGGCSLPGLRPEVAAQLFERGADDHPA